MPSPSSTLYGPDTIAEFELAARQRFDEGVALANAGFHGGAIYLHGYVAEMLLKAAGYKLFGLGLTDAVEDKRPIVEEWIGEYVLMTKKKPRPHDLDAWARWLIYMRTAILGTPYPSSFSLELGSNKDVIERLWMPSMRYHQLSWSATEAADVQTAAQWFFDGISQPVEEREMPVVPQQPLPPVAERERLVEKLAQELSREGESGEPLIFENPIQDTKKFFAIVIWSEWRFVPVRQRASIILEAYQKYDEGHPDTPKGPHLAMASGLTWDEAEAKGLLPFSIYPYVREGLDPQSIHNAMVQEGGIETASGVKLFFASRSPAEAALQRLYARLPEARWTLSERIPSGQGD